MALIEDSFLLIVEALITVVAEWVKKFATFMGLAGRAQTPIPSQ
jgi:hypothetical protein